MGLFVLLYFLTPATQPTSSTTLNYTQFQHDVSAQKVKTVTIGSNGSAKGTLTNGHLYTTTIPPQAGESFLSNLEAHGVQISATGNGSSFSSTVLSWVVLLLPFVVLGWLWLRLSRGAGRGGLQGALGVGRSKAKVFDEERPSTTFEDVAGYEGVLAAARFGVEPA